MYNLLLAKVAEDDFWSVACWVEHVAGDVLDNITCYGWGPN